MSSSFLSPRCIYDEHQQQQQRKRPDNNNVNYNVRPSIDLQPTSPFFLKYQSDSYTLDSDCALHLTKKVLDDMNILLRVLYLIPKIIFLTILN